MSLMSDSLSGGLKKGKRVSLPDAPAKVNSDSDVYWKQIPYVGPFFRRMALASTGGIGDMLEGIGTMANSETIRNAGNYFSDMAREGEAELPPLRKPELSLDYMLDENGPIGATGMLAGSMVDMMLPAGVTMKALSKIPAVMKGAGAVKNALEATKVGQKISPYVTTGAVLGATSAPWESVMEAGSASRELREGGADEQTIKDRTNDVFWQNMALLPFTNMAEMGLTGKYLDIVKDIYKPSIKTILGEKGVKQMMTNAAKAVPEMAIGTAIQGLEEGLQGGINQNAIDPNSGASINPFNWTEQQWDDAKLGVAGMLLPSAVGVGSAGIRSGRTGEVDNDRLFSAMANQESTSYTAVNPDTGAYGRYQIMPENWAAWAEEAGLPADAEKTPENQDIVAKHKFDEYVREYGPKGALVAWYAGPHTAEQYVANPDSEAWDRPQDGYPSINGYINGVFGHYDGNDLELISVPNSTAPAENDTLDTSALNSSYNDYTTEHNRLVGEGLYDDTPEDYLRMISEVNPRGTGSLALKHSDFAQSALDSGDETRIKETAQSLGYGSDKVAEPFTEEPTAEGTTTEEAKPVRTEPEAKIIDNSKKAKTPTKPLSKEEEKLLQEWYSTASAADGEIAMMDTMLIDAGQSGNWDGVRAVINRDKAKYNSNANRTDMARPTAENGLAVNTPSASSPMNVPYSSGLSQKGAGSGVMTPVHQPPTPQSFIPDALNQLKGFIRQMLKDPQALANANGEAKLNKLNVEKALKGNDFNSLNRLASLLRRNKDSHAIAQKPVGTSAPNTTMPSTLNGKSPAMSQLDTEIAEDEKKRDDKKKADERARQDRKKQERAELREECAKLADYAEARGIRKDKNGNPINFAAIRKSLKNASTDKLNTIRRLLTEAIESRAHTDRVVDEVINKIDEVKYAFRNAVESSDNGKMYLEGAIRAITNLADEPMRQYKDDVAVLSVLRNAVDRAVKEINDMAGNSPLQMKTVDHVPEPAPPPAPKKGKTTKKAEGTKKKAGKTKTKEKAEVKSEEKVEDAESKVKEENKAKEEPETKAETKTKTKAEAKEVEEVVDELEEDKYPDNAPTLENVTDITEAEFDELEDLGIRFKRKGKLVDGKPSWTLTFFSEDDKSRFVAAVYDEMEDEESAVAEDIDTPPMQEEVVEKEPEAEPKEEPAEIAEEPEEEAVDESEEKTEEEAVDEDAIADEEARKLEAKKASKKSTKAKVDDSFGGQIAGVIAGIKDKSISSVREVGKGFVVPFPADTSSKGKDKKANDDFRSIYNNLQMASGLAGFFSKEDFNSFLEKAKEESAKAGLTGEQAEYINDVVDKMKAWNEADLSTKFSASKEAESKTRTSQEVQLELVKDEFPKATDIKQDGDTITFKLGDKEVTINFVDSIILTPSEEEAFERDYGKKSDGYTIKGKTAKVDGNDVITLLNNGDDTISHEAFHLACNLALSEKEYNTLMDEYGDEEKAAEAYRKQGGKTFDTSNPIGKIFQKIWDMANSLARTLDLGTWAFGAKSVMRAIETNDIYKLAPKDGKSQTAYVHPKYLAVLHSSASNIKKFSTSHVDNDENGEGAQVHGWGIYFTRTKKAAQFYFNYFKQFNTGIDGKPINSLYRATRVTIEDKTIDHYTYTQTDPFERELFYRLKDVTQASDVANNPSGDAITEAMITDYRREIDELSRTLSDYKDFSLPRKKDFVANYKEYWKDETYRDGFKSRKEFLAYHEGTLSFLEKEIETISQKVDELKKVLKAITDGKIKFDVAEDSLDNYTTLLSVEVPELDVMIREDEPFENQPPKVQKALRSAFKELFLADRGDEKFFDIWLEQMLDDYEGDSHQDIATTILKHYFGLSPRKASQFLNKHGIEGISYEGGRDGECCVIFNDEAIKILDKTHDANDEEFFERHRKRLGVAKFSAESSNTTKLDKLPKVSYTKMNKTEKAIVNFGKSVGIPIHLVDAPQNAGNRGVFTHNGEIFINRKGNAPAKDIFFHEFTHWIRATQSDVYDMLRASVGDITQDRLDSYAKTIVGGEEMSNDELIEEIVADGMSNASSMEKMFDTVSNMNDGIIGKVASFLRNMLDKFFNAFGLNPSRMLTEQKMPNHLNAEEMAKLNSVVNKALANLKNADGKKMFTNEKGKWKLNGKAISEHEVKGINDMDVEESKEEIKPPQYFDKHSMAFPASASIKNAVDRALTRLAGTWGIKKGRDNVTVLTKKDIDPEKYDDISLIQYLFTSPQRLAKAFPKLGRIVQLAKKATDVQEQLRVRNNDVMTEVEDLLGYKKWGKNDKEYATRKSNLVNALYDGDVMQTEFTDAELKDKGLDDNTIKAYRKIRTLLKKVWDEVNDKRVGNVSKAINVSDAELMSKLAELNGDKFITVVNHTPNGRGGHIINYKEARSWVRKSMMSKDELDSLKKSDSVQILTESEIINPDVTKDSAKDPYFKVTYKERIGDMGKINGYVPHLFHEYFVVAEKDGQHQIITSAQSINEAVDKANDYAEKNPSEKVLVRPKMFIPNEEDAEMSAVAMGDYDYAKVMKMFSDNHDMTVSEAKELTDGILKKNARHRFLGNAKHRKGASGYDENIMTALQHYLNQTSRYIAMEDFKVGAITHYEKVFGDFTSSDVTDKSISAKWAKQFIRDVNGNPTTTENMLNSIFFNLGFSREKANGRPALWLSHWLTYPMTITKLGLCNVSSAMINLTQLMNMAAAMDKNWAGKDGALKYIKVGMDEYYKTFSDKAKRDFLNNQLGLKSQIGIDVAGGYSNAENKTGGAIKDIANRSMSLFKTVDTLCRGVTLLGAYRSALDSGKSKAEALRYAKEVNDKANFDYSVADAPSIFRNWGPISQVLFQFKKYPVKELELMCDVLSGGTGNYKDFRKLDNIKTFVERFSPYVLMSGVAGIPFISTVGGLCSLLASMLFGEDIDWDEEMKERVFDIGGADNPIVQAGLYGALAPLGVNVGTRVGVGDFMGVDTNRQSLIGNIAQFSTMLNSMEQFFTQLGYRNYTEMVKAISPSLGNLLQAIEGEARTTRGMLKYSYEDKPLERMIRAIGFTPTNESLENDLKKIEYRKSTREKNEKERAIDAFLDDESPENLKRLKELGVSSSSVKTAREKRKRTIREINEENNSKKKPSVPKHETDSAYY